MYAKLVTHRVSREERLVVSDPGNKKGVAGVKMPGPGQLVCSEGCADQELLFSQIPLLLPKAAPLSPSLQGCRSSEGSRPPSQAHLSQFGPQHCWEFSGPPPRGGTSSEAQAAQRKDWGAQGRRQQAAGPSAALPALRPLVNLEG